MSTPAIHIPQLVEQYCRDHSLGEIVRAVNLQGGIQSIVRRLQTSTGQTLILKQHPHAPADWYALEAEGLKLLKLPNCARVPEVYFTCPAFLLLEDIADPHLKPITDHYWESFGRKLATLHRITQKQHGFSHDNYLGLMPQTNPLTDSGHEFFIQNRVLRYLYMPLTHETLTREDIKGVERLCERIRRDVPAQPASLCHGDLWTGNMMVGPGGEPAYIDPAVHYGWAEAELSLTRQFGGVPDCFYDAYNEVNPLTPGWQDRMPLYELKEILALIAQFGDVHDMVAPLRETIAKFA